MTQLPIDQDCERLFEGVEGLARRGKDLDWIVREVCDGYVEVALRRFKDAQAEVERMLRR